MRGRGRASAVATSGSRAPRWWSVGGRRLRRGLGHRLRRREETERASSARRPHRMRARESFAIGVNESSSAWRCASVVPLATRSTIPSVISLGPVAGTRGPFALTTSSIVTVFRFGLHRERRAPEPRERRGLDVAAVGILHRRRERRPRRGRRTATPRSSARGPSGRGSSVVYFISPGFCGITAYVPSPLSFHLLPPAIEPPASIQKDQW